MPTRADYEELRRTFRLDVPARFNYARDVLYDRAQTHPDSLALVAVHPDGRTAERFDFAAIASRVAATAAVLADAGVAAGDRVFLMLPRIVQWYDVLLGCLHLGAIPMPATMQLSARDVAYRVNLADATAVVTDATGVAAVGAALPDCPGASRRLLVGEVKWTARASNPHLRPLRGTEVLPGASDCEVVEAVFVPESGDWSGALSDAVVLDARAVLGSLHAQG